ncbi:MAG: type IX secretion system sortase PorU [Sporocytophaga sp.]|uniref:type IX secretion system sortase PorU n=1 Tax=Sporocytophaga sp. TaxID=2231183 RepID=UPI001B23E063|nr:type IX secretion system sortase PorU [Sporocytophaga sp.]MBO9702336.1 type IX secretion system sortase PorU [Sporocytophaga sp.]
MKFIRLLLIFLLTYSFQSIAQHSNPRIRITWGKPVNLQTKDKGITVPDFSSAYHLENQGFLPSYHIQIYDEIVEEFEVIADSIETLDTETMEFIKGIAKDKFETIISISYFKGKPVSDIFIVPILTTSGSYMRLRTFFYNYKSSKKNLISTSPTKITRRGNYTKLAAAASNSVLANGSWFKLSISNSGVFKLDYNFLLNIGLNPSSINPRELKIYGNGGGMLPQNNSTPRYDDLVENAIYVYGENDGKFDPQDYILFYGVGPHVWRYNEIEKSFNHSYNLYSDFSYYFLTTDSGDGLRISNQASLDGASVSIEQFDERYFFEKDEAQVMTTPWVPSGRLWIGDIFNYNLQNTYNYDATGIIPNSDILLRSASIGRSSTRSSFNVSLNNTHVGTHEFTRYFEDPYADYPYLGEYKVDTWKINSSNIQGTNFSIKYSFNKNGKTEAKGYLDFFEIFIQKKLRIYGDQTAFRSLPSLNNIISEYRIDNTNNSEFIWDITDPLFVKNQDYNFNSEQSSFSANSSILKEYIIFRPINLNAPNFEGKIENQNLHGFTEAGIPDNLIITTEEFLRPAHELAQYHKDFDNIESYVVTVKNIYNEFSSGAQDICAIRDFIKMVYDRSKPGDSLRYVTLFGDCSLDYKNRIPNNTNFVPIYESYESLNPVDSYSSDDFYGFMDPNEGDWNENPNVNDKMELGIGRLPVKTEAEAYEILQKIKQYKSDKSLGKWRNNITLIAGNKKSTEPSYQNNVSLSSAESLSLILNQKGPNYNINKIYLPAYPLTYTPSGAICPMVNDLIKNEFDKGTFILNYVGHGSETQLSQENILNTSIISELKNQYQLPFIIAATCQFGRYDFPGILSGIETAFLNREGGSIGSLAPSRPVISTTNHQINKAFYETVFLKNRSRFLTLGDIILLTKNNSTSGINNRSYALIGDPCLTLNYPKEEILITKINGQNFGEITDTLKALQKVKLEGEIQSEGKIISDYNGELNLRLFDKETTVATLESPVTNFNVQNTLIYDGSASLKNGKFAIEFIIPKDISYQCNKGKISLYGSNSPKLGDGAGSLTNIIIGGANKNAVDDITPPVIKAYMNDESFVFGGITNSNPKLIVNLFDESGINLASSGIGHEISLILDNSNEPISLNEFYTTKLDSYKNGTVTFNLRNLTPGNHSIKIKAWDTYNNSSDTYLEFVVVNNEDIDLSHILNYPNPFTTHTEFHFDHNRSGDDIDVMIQIYTVSGKLIKTISERFYISPAHISNLFWNGRDDFGDKIGKGVYVYKVSVKSLSDGNHKSKFQKLLILN